ncbi:MAG: RluA family pseudouridine synthase [Candidatus Latescibacteria bacterium]|nr:RluA family pseudouridine synthase [Candidatus Latescibacterota bacterium]
MAGSKPERRELTVTSQPGLPTTPQEDGERLDHFLGRQFEDLSRSRIEALIKEEAVTVDGRRPKGSRPAVPGQVIVLVVPPAQEPSLDPENIPLDIRYEDRHLVVVNKPPGMVVHPAPGHPSGTLVNALLYHCRDLSGIGGVLRPGIVHRLDKDTSGLLVVAKSQVVHIALAAAMKERKIHRLYNAVVWGHPEPEEGTIETWIGRNRTDRKRMAAFEPHKTALEKRWGRPGEEERMLKGSRTVRAAPQDGTPWIPRGARPAVTRYRTITRYDVVSSVECVLETGRTHQIRVHFSHSGHPVVGDPMYGGRKKAVRGFMPEKRTRAESLLDVMPRQALHSLRLQFEHPVSGEEISIEAELPPDMQHLMQQLAAIGFHPETLDGY